MGLTGLRFLYNIGYGDRKRPIRRMISYKYRIPAGFLWFCYIRKF